MGTGCIHKPQDVGKKHIWERFLTWKLKNFYILGKEAGDQLCMTQATDRNSSWARMIPSCECCTCLWENVNPAFFPPKFHLLQPWIKQVVWDSTKGDARVALNLHLSALFAEPQEAKQLFLVWRERRYFGELPDQMASPLKWGLKVLGAFDKSWAEILKKTLIQTEKCLILFPLFFTFTTKLKWKCRGL